MCFTPQSHRRLLDGMPGGGWRGMSPGADVTGGRSGRGAERPPVWGGGVQFWGAARGSSRSLMGDGGNGFFSHGPKGTERCGRSLTEAKAGGGMDKLPCLAWMDSEAAVELPWFWGMLCRAPRGAAPSPSHATGPRCLSFPQILSCDGGGFESRDFIMGAANPGRSPPLRMVSPLKPFPCWWQPTRGDRDLSRGRAAPRTLQCGVVQSSCPRQGR